MTTPYVSNPYIIGRPIGARDLLFGREKVFSWIKDNLEGGKPILLLHGQRRVGKSSVIHQIPQRLGVMEDFVFVSIDCSQFYFSNQQSWNDILAALAQEILERLGLQGIIIQPTTRELEAEIDIFEREFLPQVYQRLETKKLVLLLDEFDAVIPKKPEFSAVLFNRVFRKLFEIIGRDNKLCVVLFIGDHLINTLDIVGTLRKFRDIPTVEIGLLEEDSAIKLITKPVENLFEYEEEAIKTIFSLSAGHPYIIQIICFAIFSKVRQNNSFAVKVTATDVKAVLDQAMEIGEAGLSSFWYGFSVFERIVLSAVAQGKETGVNYLDLLASYQIDPENSLIRSATKQLFATGFFDNTGNIQIELMRRWIVRRYPLADEINLLREFQESENLRDVELKFNPESDEFGDNIVNNIIGDDNTINDNNTVSDDNRISKFLPSSRSQSNLMIISAIINTLVLIILSVILASFYRLMTPSRSDQNIFPNTKNRDRNFNLAIETLEKADYQRAVELFEKAMQDNPKDPEVLILYNNALANQQGSPLAKLAVVLPVTGVRFTDNIQQEILRGVAQAQDEFNQKRRKQNKNARLVEILVCNKKTTAEQVAKELVDEPSISGVIDYDAHDREFTIPIYEKSELAVIFSPVADATSKIPSFFKAASSDISVNSAQKLAEYAHNNLQAKTAVIFANPQNGYGKKMIEEFRNRFKTLGGEVTKVVDFTGPNFDAMEAVNELQSPIAVLFPDRENVSPAVNIAKARSDSSDKQVRGLKLLTGDTLYGDNIPAENIRAMEGMVFSIPGFSNNNMIQGQKASQTAETSYMATSYNATQLLIESLSPNAERGIIRNKLLKKQKIILVELKNGRFVPIKVSK